MGFSRRAFNVLWVVERSRSQRRRVGVVGPYHRHHHLNWSAPTEKTGRPVHEHVKTYSESFEGRLLFARHPHTLSLLPRAATFLIVWV